MVRERYPLINHLHVFSNGPATQYKQKGNFYLLSKKPFKRGFKGISWNFFEASHGKGAPDGVGDTLKRSADTIVCHGGDIPNAEAMFHKLRNMGFVGEEDEKKKESTRNDECTNACACQRNHENPPSPQFLSRKNYIPGHNLPLPGRQKCTGLCMLWPEGGEPGTRRKPALH